MIASGLVPRETTGKLEVLVSLLARWNRRTNLLSRREAADIWERHILDSAQLLPLAPREAKNWLDLGAGAGFPGLVCAAIASTEGRQTRFTLVEADGTKTAFLREAARQMELDVTVLHQRIQTLALPPQDVISARALAPLEKLLEYSAPFVHPGTRLLFPKGRKADSELTLARRAWHSRVVRVPSRTDPEGVVLQISELRRRR